MSFGRSLSTCSLALFAALSFPSPEYAVASALQASGSFGCAFVLLRALFTAALLVELLLLPKTLKLPRSRSPSPVEPEPTPKNTNPPAKTKTSKTKTHFACRRRRGKNIVCSIGGGRRAAAWRRVPGWDFAVFFRVWAAPRAIGP